VLVKKGVCLVVALIKMPVTWGCHLKKKKVYYYYFSQNNHHGIWKTLGVGAAKPQIPAGRMVEVQTQVCLPARHGFGDG
jgi:hypothetical protein